MLKAWLKERCGEPDDPVFPNQRGPMRHTAAMELLTNGVDRAVIALWLGHESVDST